MSHVSTNFSNTAEFDALAQSIAAKLGCETSLISIVCGGVLTTLGDSRMEPDRDKRVLPERDTICGRTVRLGRPLRVVDVRTDPDIGALPAVKASNIGACLGVPLKTENGTTVGAIYVLSESARIWQDSEVEYLQAVADLAESKIARQFLRYEQKALCAALAESDAILSMLSNVQGRALTVHNADGDLVFANAGMKDDLRLSDCDILALPKIARTIRQQNLAQDRAHVVRSTPTNTELSVQLTTADNGLILAEWSRTA